MITQRVNQWDYEDEDLAYRICEELNARLAPAQKFKRDGKQAWTKGTTVYWIEDSTD